MTDNKYRVVNRKTGKIILCNNYIILSDFICEYRNEKEFIIQHKLEYNICKGCLEDLSLRQPWQCLCCCGCGDYKCVPIIKTKWEKLNINKLK